MRRSSVVAHAAVLSCLLAIACGNSDECGAGAACGKPDVDAAPAVIDPVAPGRVPPPDPGQPLAQGSAPTVLAIRRVFLGDTDWNGEKSAEAWRGYGLNLDGILSTQEGTNHCAPAPPEGAPQMNKVDGEEVIDNSFGKNLLPIFIALAPDQAALTNAAIDAGDHTLLFDLRNLDASDTLSGVDCATFEGGPRAVPPVWNGVDQWPVAWESVENGDPSKPRLIAAASYLTNGTFVSAPKLDPLPLRMRGEHEIELSVRSAVVTVELTGSGATASAKRGIIAGVLEIEAVVEELRRTFGLIDSDKYCGDWFEPWALGVRQAADIMLDGTNGDPTQKCNGISFGIGFEAEAVERSGVAAPRAPNPSGCPPQ